MTVKTSGKRYRPLGGGSKVRVGRQVRDMLNVHLNDDLIVTPVLSQFLQTWDGSIAPHVAERLARLMSQKPRKRAGTFSASSAGFCWRRQELTFLGIPQPNYIEARVASIFDNGRWVHLRWQAVLMTAGILDDIEMKFKKKSKRARMTADGVGEALTGRFIGREFGFELKGRNLFHWNTQSNTGIDPKTQAQVDFEFMMTGLDLWSVVNENKNNQVWKEWVFVRNDERVKEMAKQLAQLNRAIDRKKLHPMLDECKKKQGEWNNCPYGGSMSAPCINVGDWP